MAAATGPSIMAGRWIKLMSARAAFPATFHEKRRHYDQWLDEGPKVTAPMDGLSAEGTLALDKAGLAARGWSDLPLGWTPPDNAVLHGGYGENRAIYDTPIFNPPGTEPRTIHLGLDVFAAAGTIVRAPLHGRVHSVQRNDNAKDYGPTLILEHDVSPALRIYTLYGHLGADVLSRFEAGDKVDAGDQIGRLGDVDINGGWAPHLHFQIMLDLLGMRGDFPGVCRQSEAEDWLTLCPDPRELIGLAT